MWNNWHKHFFKFINIKNHDYKTGEIVKYSVNGTEIDGLSTDKEYYVSVINEDQFKLLPLELVQQLVIFTKNKSI